MIKLIVLLSICLINLLLAFFVIYKNRRNQINRTYFFFTLSVFFWILTNLLFQMIDNWLSLYILAILSYLSAIGIVYFLFIFSLIFPQIVKENKKLINIVKFVTLVIVTLTSIPNIVLQDIQTTPVKGLVTNNGLFVYGGYLLIFFSWSLYNLYKSYKNSEGASKQRLRFVFLGLFTSIFFGIILNLILPIFKIYTFIWLGPAFSIFMIIAFAYAIVKYRLMNIKLIITRSFIFFFLTLSVTATFVLVSSFSVYFFSGVTGRSQYFIWAIAAIIIVLVIDPLKRGLAQITDKYFFQGKIDYDKVTKRLTQILSEEVDVKDIIIKTENRLIADIKIKNATLLISFGDNYFLQPEEIHNIPTTKKEQSKRHHYPALVEYLQKNKTIIVVDELERKISDIADENKASELKKVYNDIKELEAAVIAPIFRQNEISALLLLGSKTSGEIFNDEDINLLEVLSPQLSAALFKANLFQEAKLFNIKLKQEVERATRELTHANEHLMELDKAKSEFMSIASHQLRTPLSGIMGYLSMIMEGDYGRLTKQQAPILKEVFGASQRLIRLVNLFLNVTRIEAGRLSFSWKEVDFVKLLEEQVHELKPTAVKKNVKLDFIKPKTKLPIIMVDEDKIQDVVLNLIDNAIKYTDQGKVEVTVAKRGASHIELTVKDNGVGINPDEADKLFNKFVRGDGMVQINPDGAGLGLFIAKKITEGHKGKIWAESKGLEKGSTFHVVLPIKQK